jgi:hypothetical protein
MNATVNITGVMLKLSSVNVEQDMLFKKKTKQEKLDYIKNWQLNNKEKVKGYKKNWQLNNKEYGSKWFQKNKKIVLKKRSLKLKTDYNFKMKHQLGTRIRKALGGYVKKSKKTKDLIGCSVEQLWIHLEKSFKIGMTKENYGKWHVDHIRPCASFDLNKPEEQYKCFHYTNLQALWAHENFSKGAKYTT